MLVIALVPEAIAATHVIKRVADDTRESGSDHPAIYWRFWHATGEQIYVVGVPAM